MRLLSLNAAPQLSSSLTQRACGVHGEDADITTNCDSKDTPMHQNDPARLMLLISHLNPLLPSSLFVLLFPLIYTRVLPVCMKVRVYWIQFTWHPQWHCWLRFSSSTSSPLFLALYHGLIHSRPHWASWPQRACLLVPQTPQDSTTSPKASDRGKTSSIHLH